MKLRAAVIALTLTLALFIPMTAVFAKEDLPVAKPKAPQKMQSSSQALAEGPAESGTEDEPEAEKPEALPEEYFRIYDMTEQKVKNIGYEEFVRGAIAAEMGAGFEHEALVAQGTAALSCALYQKESHFGADYDFTADPSKKLIYMTEEKAKEVYGDNFEESWGKICKAADEAMKMVVTYGGKPAMTVYHAISAGTTEDAKNVWGGEVPYLVPVKSPGDLLSEDFETTVKISREAALEKLNSYGANLNGKAPEQWFEGAKISPAGYVDEIQIGAAIFPGTKLRSLFGLRSTAFSVEYNEGEFVFTVRGYGHGVGMSQVGANHMAQNGASAKEILEHYYPGTVIVPCS